MISTTTMTGVVLHEHGSLDKLVYSDSLEKPEINENEILVKVEYCGINHLDIWLRKGGTGDKINLPKIPGSDVVGEIVAIGESVNNVKIGDNVVLYPGKGCGCCTSCVKGRETLCKDFQVLGYNIDGGYAQYLKIESKRALPISSSSKKEWAGVPVSYITAWNALITKGKLTKNDTVVIWGASGGLGYACLSIAQKIGAKIIAIVSSEEKIEVLRSKGFQEVEFLLRSKNIVRDIRHVTNNVGADLILDHIGSVTVNNSMKILKRGGRLSLCGVTSGPKAEIDIRQIFGKQITITGTWLGELSDFIEVKKLIEDTKAFPLISREFSLEQAGLAQETLEEGKHVGKIILKI